MGWLADSWGLVELDLQQLYGIDLGDRELLLARDWPWLQRRVYGLLGTRSRLLWSTLTEHQQETVREAMGNGANPVPWH